LSLLKTLEQQAARHLRTHGRSVKEIAATLGVAKSSVSVWVRHVPLSPDARRRLAARIRLGPVVAGERKAALAREIRRGYQQIGRARVRTDGATYAAGCMLYWAEGGKGRNTVAMSNSDPELLVAFVGFLREHFGVTRAQISIYCNLFADHVEKQNAIEQFWLDRLGLPRTSLRKSQVNVYSKYSQKKRKGKLPYGTCKLVVHSSQIVQTIFGSIQEYGGFDRPEWLD
jgi:transposase-like protein